MKHTMSLTIPDTSSAFVVVAVAAENDPDAMDVNFKLSFLSDSSGEKRSKGGGRSG